MAPGSPGDGLRLIAAVAREQEALGRAQGQGRRRCARLGRACSRLDAFFQVSARGSSVATEVKAGLVTFLTMSYILLVNPQILALAGLDKSRAATATAVTASVATLIAGLCGNVPFGLSSGMGINTMFALTHVKIDGFAPELVLSWCFIAAACLFVLALCRALKYVMAAVPSEIKQGTVVGMGLLLAFIGMKDGGIVKANADTIVEMGPLFSDWHVMLVVGELLLIGALMMHGVKTAILAGIALGTLTCWGVEHSWPGAIAVLPEFLSCFKMPDFHELKLQHVANMLPYLLVMVFDIGGIVFGLGKIAGLVRGENTVKGSIWCYIGAAAGSILGAFMGTSPLIVAAESAAGIKAGGRTGLTAVVVSLLFAASVFLSPVIVAIPLYATAPVLILVGTLMMSEGIEGIDWHSIRVALPAFLTIAVQPFTFSISNGIYFGVLFSFGLWLASGEWARKCPFGQEQGPDPEETTSESGGANGGSVTSSVDTIERLVSYHHSDAASGATTDQQHSYEPPSVV